MLNPAARTSCSPASRTPLPQGLTTTALHVASHITVPGGSHCSPLAGSTQPSPQLEALHTPAPRTPAAQAEPRDRSLRLPLHRRLRAVHQGPGARHLRHPHQDHHRQEPDCRQEAGGRLRRSHNAINQRAQPLALNYISDPRLGDLGEHLPALFEDGFDRQRERLDRRTAALADVRRRLDDQRALLPPSTPASAAQVAMMRGMIDNVAGTVADAGGFVETWQDDGDTDMAECIRAWRSVGYAGAVRPDHVPGVPKEARTLEGWALWKKCLRGILPAASLSNVGIYGTGQAYEALLLRMRSHPLPEARTYADLMLGELRKVIPSFLKRVDLADRGVAWSDYLGRNREAMDDVAERFFPSGATEAQAAPRTTLVDFDPDAEVHLVTAMLYAHTHLPEVQVEQRVRAMSAEERLAVVKAYVGERANRRHRPGRARRR